MLCPWARHFTPRKYWLITQEAMAPSRHDWKIVDWDVKPQHNQPTNCPSIKLIWLSIRSVDSYFCMYGSWLTLSPAQLGKLVLPLCSTLFLFTKLKFLFVNKFSKLLLHILGLIWWYFMLFHLFFYSTLFKYNYHKNPKTLDTQKSAVNILKLEQYRFTTD